MREKQTGFIATVMGRYWAMDREKHFDRTERDRREDRAWWRYSLPEAVISVKQAAGRLIRSATDTGVLVLADSRVVTKGYGRLFVGSLPSGNVSRIESANVGRYIKMWRATHE